MALEIVSLSIGVGAILVAFPAAVDGYLLFEQFTDNDNDSLNLACLYHTQRQLLKNWGDRFNVNDPDPAKCLLHDENEGTQTTILNILSRIQELHKKGNGIIDRHGMSSSLENPAGDHANTQGHFNLGSLAVANISKSSAARKLKSKIRWTIKDKKSFSSLVADLTQFNAALEQLLSPKALKTFKITTPSYVLADLNGVANLRRIVQAGVSTHQKSLEQSAKLKEINTTAHTQTTTELQMSDFTFLKSKSSTSGETQKLVTRPLASYNLARVWIEWRTVEDSVSEADAQSIHGRLLTLGDLLAAVFMEELRIPQCVGVINDKNHNILNVGKRVGFAFAVPSQDRKAEPITLLDIITTKCKEPPLGDKFKLAYDLATSLTLFHSSQWIHKAFRSDNILFFEGLPKEGTKYPSLSNPYITGFGYSREINMDSIDNRPSGAKELDYYYPPQVANGFTKLIDLYSLGVILLEIAWWKPLHATIPSNKARSLDSIQQVLLKATENHLDSMVGTMYADVVRACLNCSLPDDDDEEFACSMANDVVMKLQLCRA